MGFALGSSAVLTVVAAPLSTVVVTLFFSAAMVIEFRAIRRSLLRRISGSVGPRKPGRLTRALVRHRASVSTVLLAGWIVAMLLILPPWLPREKIAVNGGPNRTVYVLKDDDRGLEVLDDKRRAVEKVPHSAVDARQICTPRVTLGNFGLVMNRSLLSLFFDGTRSRYTTCPT
jgi:hypothetical protein